MTVLQTLLNFEQFWLWVFLFQFWILLFQIESQEVSDGTHKAGAHLKQKL